MLKGQPAGVECGLFYDPMTRGCVAGVSRAPASLHGPIGQRVPPRHTAALPMVRVETLDLLEPRSTEFFTQVLILLLKLIFQRLAMRNTREGCPHRAYKRQHFGQMLWLPNARIRAKAGAP